MSVVVIRKYWLRAYLRVAVCARGVWSISQWRTTPVMQSCCGGSLHLVHAVIGLCCKGVCVSG